MRAWQLYGASLFPVEVIAGAPALLAISETGVNNAVVVIMFLLLFTASGSYF